MSATGGSEHSASKRRRLDSEENTSDSQPVTASQEGGKMSSVSSFVEKIGGYFFTAAPETELEKAGRARAAAEENVSAAKEERDAAKKKRDAAFHGNEDREFEWILCCGWELRFRQTHENCERRPPAVR